MYCLMPIVTHSDDMLTAPTHTPPSALTVKKSLAAAAASGTAAAAPSQPAVNAIMWFRQDLRIHDNPALVEAAKWAQRRGGSVVCVYVHSPAEDGDVVGHGSRCGLESDLQGQIAAVKAFTSRRAGASN